MKNHLVISIAAVVLLSGCATPVAKPAFYPNAHYQRVGPAQAQADAQFCDELAQQSDVKAVNKVDAGRAAAAGAAGVGTAGVVGSVLNGGKPNLKNIAAGAAVIGISGLWFPDLWLSATEVPADLWPDVRAYLRILALALVPSLLFRMYSTLNQSLGHPRLVTWLQAGALLIKVPLSFVLTFGGAGFAGMGVVGCAWATLAVNTLMMLAGLWLLRTQDIYQAYRLWRRPEKPDWPVIRRFLALGVPAGLSIMVEVTSFTLMALFIARLGAVALASHQIAASLAAVLYMVPLALGIASSARTGYWLGAGQAHKARRAAGLGIGLAIGAALLGAALLFMGRETLAHAFSTDPHVVQAATLWLAWVALYHLADAVQAVCAYLLRCYRITILPLVVYTALLWGVGLYGGYRLAYQGLDWAGWPMRASVDTFWITSTAALALVSVLFAALVWHASRPLPSRATTV